MGNDALGDRCKQFELAEAGRRAERGLPLLARLDGRAFHTFTRDLKRPYDHGMSVSMIETARYLVQEMQALVGYTQSDEITLAWYEPADSTSDYMFDGRFQKIASVLAGMASARFAKLVAQHLPQKADETPHFDCRVWQVPTIEDAADVLVWREDDATKNSISMAACAHYSDRELDGKASNVKQEMLLQKGVDWDAFPAFFKRGTYLGRRTFDKTLTEAERARIPEAHRPPVDATFKRTQVVDLDLPRVRSIGNLNAVLFERADPIARS
ncbi:MAG: tRNA(His) guanylyltransferase Thg1 family protein [Myxococcota bacterium]|nr:tRNA(His) guanylyltransferase Thg1 family protein [Myxococcota bacterium]